MFTGLIEEICPVKGIKPESSGMRLTVDLKGLAGEVETGDSIAVNGVCLTVSDIRGGDVNFDVSCETVSKTTINELKTGKMVNIERAMRAGGRFGGHFVQGHIDGKAKIDKIENTGQFWNVSFQAEREIMQDIIKKGSVAVDGISFTAADVDENGFTVAIIPETWNKTNLQFAKAGQNVNIETDIIVKTVRKQLENIASSEGNLTIDKLKELGF
jgi:riboflavin synthase